MARAASENPARYKRRIDGNLGAMFVRHAGLFTGILSLASAAMANIWGGRAIHYAYVRVAHGAGAWEQGLRVLADGRLSDGNQMSLPSYLVMYATGYTLIFGTFLLVALLVLYVSMRWRGEHFREQLQRYREQQAKYKALPPEPST